MDNNSKNNNLEKYLLYAAIFIEIGLIAYFSITTKNVFQYTLSFLLMIVVTFPLGFAVSIFLFREKSLSELLILSLCIGFPLSAGVWGLLTCYLKVIMPIVYLGTIYLISAIFIIITVKKYKIIFQNKEFCRREICLPLIVLLIGFVWHSVMIANNNVLFDVDGQSTIYLETLIKNQGYPSVNPYLMGENVNITHPPTFHTLVILPSIIKSSLVYKECMAITVVCGAYFVLAVYLLAYYLSAKNHFIAFFAGVLTLNRAYLSNFNDGNTSESFAFLCVAVYILFLLHAFEKRNWSKLILFASIGGFVFTHAGLSQTEIFEWYSLSLLFFAATYWWAKRESCVKDISAIAISLVVAAIFVLPWFFLASSSFKGSMWQVTGKHATEFGLALTYWHSYVILGLSLVGGVILIIKRNKIGIFIVTHILAMFFLIVHWKILRVMDFEWFSYTPANGNIMGANGHYTAPGKFIFTFTVAWYSLTIGFPIAASYGLDLANNLLKKLAIFRFKCKTLSVSLVLIFIGISVFMCYEYKNYRRYPEWLIETDYETLLWFHDNTSYDDTLILNPEDPVKMANGASIWTTNWVPSVTERRSINARGLGGEHVPLSKEFTGKKSLLSNAFYNIQSPNVYELLKSNGVTHIFVSALLAGQVGNVYTKTPFLELVHYKTIENLGTALIFKVK